MISPYVPWHRAFAEHPKLKRAARKLGIHPLQLGGHLMSLWHSALDYHRDGDLGRADADDIADAARWDGDAAAFVEALAGAGGSSYEHGFLELDHDGSLRLHDWCDHMGAFVATCEQAHQASRNGLFGSHVKYHVKAKPPKVDPDCEWCNAKGSSRVATKGATSPPAVGGYVGGHKGPYLATVLKGTDPDGSELHGSEPNDPADKPRRSPKVEVLSDADLVVARINELAGKRLQGPSAELKARIREHGVEACLLVVEWFGVHPWRNGAGRESFNAKSPFRPSNWDSNFDNARQWDAAGRPAIRDGSNSQTLTQGIIENNELELED